MEDHGPPHGKRRKIQGKLPKDCAAMLSELAYDWTIRRYLAVTRWSKLTVSLIRQDVQEHMEHLVILHKRSSLQRLRAVGHVFRALRVAIYSADIGLEDHLL